MARVGPVAGDSCQGHRALACLPEKEASLQQVAAEPGGPQAGWC